MHSPEFTTNGWIDLHPFLSSLPFFRGKMLVKPFCSLEPLQLWITQHAIRIQIWHCPAGWLQSTK